MGGHVAVVRFRRIVILDQVIPHAPRPDNLVGSRVVLDHGVGPHLAVGEELRVAARRQGVRAGLALSRQEQDVPIRQGLGSVFCTESLSAELVLVKLCERALGKHGVTVLGRHCDGVFGVAEPVDVGQRHPSPGYAPGRRMRCSSPSGAHTRRHRVSAPRTPRGTE
jgi:hypothetical protein